MLILDEATSALDAESEAIINANLVRIARDRTIICVSHRLAIDLLAGSDRYRMLVEAGGNPDDWVAEWEETLRDFASIREEYLLYRATDPHWA